MARKLLSVAIAALLLVGFASFMTKADVTGSFKVNIYIQPIPCGALPFATFSPGPVVYPVNCENTFTKVDFETGLIVNWTISGLTFGINSMAGFAGIEHILTTLKATLGALNISDNFFFAIPYGVDNLIITNGANQVDTETAWTIITNNLLFVKKIVNMSISIAGITLSNQAEIGDYTFPVGPYTFPCAEVYGGKCPLLPPQANYAANGYTAASQHYAFGDALTISGQTVSGITVTNVTWIDLNTSWYESFKKISLKGKICRGAGEKLSLIGLPIAAGITANETLNFKLVQAGLTEPADLLACSSLAPFAASTTVNITSALGNFMVNLLSNIPTTTIFQGVTVSFATGPLSIVQEFDLTLAALDTQASLDFTLNPDSNPASVSLTAILCQKAGVGPITGIVCGGAGLQELDVSFGVQRSGVNLQVDSTFTGLGLVTLSSLDFVVSGAAGPVSIGVDLSVIPAWSGSFNFGVNF